MRQSIGSSWIFGMVIIFILLFTAYLAVIVNYSKSFKVKNEIIDFIEKEEGMTSKQGTLGAEEMIANYLTTSGYNNYGTCNTNSNRIKGYLENSNNINHFAYCVEKSNTYDVYNPQKAYYTVTVFFTLDLPLFGNFFTFGVAGETTDIMYPADCNEWGECN